MKGVDTNLLPEDQGGLDLLLLDALDAQAREGAGHGVGVHLYSADALLAALLAHQVVRMRSVGGFDGDTGDNDDSPALVADNLKRRIVPTLYYRRRTHQSLTALTLTTL